MSFWCQQNFIKSLDMFTGIIRFLGSVQEIRKIGNKNFITIFIPYIKSIIKIGDSVACNGICLTIVKIKDKSITVEISEETSLKTDVRHWIRAELINIELPMGVNDRFDGHFVQGHIDCIGKIVSIKKQKGNYLFTFSFPPKYHNLVVENGSIAINGISMTSFDVKRNMFTVSIIEHTIENTNLKCKKVGNLVNLEFDIIGKYIVRCLN